jgi:hypothetical protein
MNTETQKVWNEANQKANSAYMGARRRAVVDPITRLEDTARLTSF